MARPILNRPSLPIPTDGTLSMPEYKAGNFRISTRALPDFMGLNRSAASSGPVRDRRYSGRERRFGAGGPSRIGRSRAVACRIQEARPARQCAGRPRAMIPPGLAAWPSGRGGRCIVRPRRRPGTSRCSIIAPTRFVNSRASSSFSDRPFAVLGFGLDPSKTAIMLARPRVAGHGSRRRKRSNDDCSNAVGDRLRAHPVLDPRRVR